MPPSWADGPASGPGSSKRPLTGPGTPHSSCLGWQAGTLRGGPRQLTRQGDSSVLIKALRYGHDYTSRIDFSGLARATEMLHATNALNEPGSSERLRLPDASH